jgi:acyl carrier protein
MSNDQRIIDALREAGIDYDAEAYDQARSFRDNGIDSLDVMSLFLAIEEKYGVKFSEEEANAINSPMGISSALDLKINQ